MNLQNIITNTATTTGITAALLLALNIQMFLVAYVLFLASSLLWAIHALHIHNKQLYIMNLVFSAINVIGVYNYM